MPWDPFLMKKLLKSKICESSEQYRRPTDVLKMVEKSKISATVHAQYMNSSICLQLRMKKKKKRKKKNAKEENKSAESKQVLSSNKVQGRNHYT